MGSADTLRGLIDQAASKYPARKYALLLDGPGGAYQGGFGADATAEGAADSLHAHELRSAVQGSALWQGSEGGRKLDLLLYASSLMGNFEVASALTGAAEVLVATPSQAASGSFGYGETLAWLSGNAQTDARAWGRRLAQEAEGGPYYALDLERLGAVETALRAYLSAGAEGLSGADAGALAASLREALSEAPYYHWAHLRDLGAYMASVGSAASVSASLRAKAAAVSASLGEALYAGGARDAAGGIGLSMDIRGDAHARVSDTLTRPVAEWNAYGNAVFAPGAELPAGEARAGVAAGGDLGTLGGEKRVAHDLSIGAAGGSLWHGFRLYEDGAASDTLSVIGLEPSGASVTLYLYGSDGTQLARDDNGDGTVSVSLDTLQADTAYYLRMDAASAVTYHIDIAAPTADGNPAPDFAEGAGGNDAPGKATELGLLGDLQSVPTLRGLTIGASDMEGVETGSAAAAGGDWFHFTAAAREQYNPNAITVSGVGPSAGNLDLYVYDDGDMSLLGQSRTDRDAETVSIPTAGRGFYIQVVGRDGESFNDGYELDVARRTFDLDGSRGYDALTDGLMALARLFDYPDRGVLDFSAAGTGALDRFPLDAYLGGAGAGLLDVDGNGRADALTDGLILLAHLFDYPAESLAGFAAPDATRDADGIADFLSAHMPEPFIA